MEAGNRIYCKGSLNRRQTVEFFYLAEGENFHRIHKRNGTIQENIDATLGSISETSIMYEVFCGDELAAFFVRYEDSNGLALDGFHVGKKFRTADFLNQFWKVVKSKFEKMFLTVINEKNEDAIKHLIKQGFSLEENRLFDDGKTFLIFKYN